jgi:hypothetical protein
VKIPPYLSSNQQQAAGCFTCSNFVGIENGCGLLLPHQNVLLPSGTNRNLYLPAPFKLRDSECEQKWPRPFRAKAVKTPRAILHSLFSCQVKCQQRKLLVPDDAMNSGASASLNFWVTMERVFL